MFTPRKVTTNFRDESRTPAKKSQGASHNSPPTTSNDFCDLINPEYNNKESAKHIDVTVTFKLTSIRIDHAYFPVNGQNIQDKSRTELNPELK